MSTPSTPLTVAECEKAANEYLDSIPRGQDAPTTYVLSALVWEIRALRLALTETTGTPKGLDELAAGLALIEQKIR